jgi:hypothetical protein
MARTLRHAPSRPHESDATQTRAHAARAFATNAADLAVRIDAQRPVEAIDALLAACLGDARGLDAPAIRGWTVARRLDALLLVRLASGRSAEPVPLRCAACGDAFEISIDLAACRPSALPERIAFEVEGRLLEARCPTGADHARWNEERPTLSQVAASLLGSDDLPADAVVANLEAALLRHDPARELPVSVACPGCGSTVGATIDLESHLLQAFAAEQRAWLREIAAVARSYPWSEAEIAAMPAWRRRYYLQLADETGAMR